MTLSEDAILTENYRKSELSFACLSAICAMAGYTCQRGPDPDLDSIDAIVKAGGFARPQIDVQLKSTSVPNLKDGVLRYRLRRKSYNGLAGLRQNPAILAVLELPPDPDEWLNCDAERLILRRRLWWVSLEGSPPLHADGGTVRIPQSQFLTPDSLKELAAEARERFTSTRNP